MFSEFELPEDGAMRAFEIKLLCIFRKHNNDHKKKICFKDNPIISDNLNLEIV